MDDATFCTGAAWTGTQWIDGVDGERHLFVTAAPVAEESPWAGAVVFLSPDGGETWIRSVGIGQPGVVGICAGASDDLAVVTSPAWDDESTLTVLVGGSVLVSQTEDDTRQARGNLLLIGDEILAFQTATALGDGAYQLTGLQRALFGSSGYGHGIADRVIGLGDAVAAVPLTDDTAGRDLIVAIATPGQTIDDAWRATVTVPPIPDRELTATPETVRDFTATAQGDGVLLSWAPQASPDVAGYEIRAGSRWHGARPVARVTGAQVEVPRIGSDSRTYAIRAQYRGGLWSPDAALATITPGNPAGTCLTAAATIEEGSWPAGLTGIVDTAGEGLQIASGGYTGTADFDAVDAGAVADWEWIVEVDTFERDLRPWDELLGGMRFDSVEARMRTCDGREPSENFPGAALGVAWDSYAGGIDDLTARGLHAYGWAGNYGQHTRVVVLVRFDETGAGGWTGYEPFEPGRRRAQKIQVRLTFDRWSTDYQRTVTRVRTEARN